MIDHALHRVMSADLELPANCYSVGRHSDLVEGIELDLNKGPDELRPWEPHIAVGKHRIHRDYWFDKERRCPLGCVYHPKGKGTALVRRANLHVIESSDRTILTLRRPEDSSTEECLLKVDLSIPGVGSIRKEGRRLNIHFGISGGETVSLSQGIALMRVKNGQRITLFFKDGGVRQLSWTAKGGLSEAHLSNKEMLSLRVNDAKERLSNLAAENEEERKQQIYWILSGMVDLLPLTAIDKVSGQDIRRSLVSEFFLELESQHLNLVHKKLKAVLHKVDSDIVEMIRQEKKTDETNVVQLDCLRDKFRVTEGAEKLSRAKNKKAERQARDREYRAECKGSSAGQNKKR